MGESKITKKWSKKGKILRAIILGALGNNAMFFDATDDNDQDNNNKDDEIKQRESSSTSVFCKLGFLPSLARVVPSSGLNGLRKLGKAVSMRKNEQQQATSVELCKKRIIMGRKCRPLNVSGALQYDKKTGVLLPELLLSPYHHSSFL